MAIDQSTVEAEDVKVKPTETDGEKLKRSLAIAREKTVNDFIVEQSQKVTDYCELEEKAEGHISSDELVTGLEQRQGNLEEAQAELSKQPILSIIRSLGGRDIAEEKTKVDSIIESRADCAPNEETSNPGRRVLAKVVKEGKEKLEESTSESESENLNPNPNLNPNANPTENPDPKRYWKEA